MTGRSGAATLLAVAVVAATLSACGGDGPSGTTPPVITSHPSAGRASASPPAPTPGAPDASDASRPPAAMLAAEGGDPVPGALGSWTWGDAGEDAPFLPGAAIALGAGEPLRVGFDPERGVARWQGRYVPTGQGDAAGARLAGAGDGAPTFFAPPPGRWSLELTVTFAGQGRTASYFWALAVR